MIKKILISLVVGLFMAFSMQMSFADDVPSTPINMSTVIQKMQTKGYNNIRKIEFDHGIFDIETLDPEGQKIKLHFNPQTGEVNKYKVEHENKSKFKTAKISILDVIKNVEKAGYHNVYKIKFEGDKYEVKAFDKNNKKIELRIDANTGEVSKEGWFD